NTSQVSTYFACSYHNKGRWFRSVAVLICMFNTCSRCASVPVCVPSCYVVCVCPHTMSHFISCEYQEQCVCVCERESESERPDLNWTAFSEPGNLILSGESCVLSRHVEHLWHTHFKSAHVEEIFKIIQVCVCV